MRSGTPRFSPLPAGIRPGSDAPNGRGAIAGQTACRQTRAFIRPRTAAEHGPAECTMTRMTIPSSRPDRWASMCHLAGKSTETTTNARVHADLPLTERVSDTHRADRGSRVPCEEPAPPSRYPIGVAETANYSCVDDPSTPRSASSPHEITPDGDPWCPAATRPDLLSVVVDRPHRLPGARTYGAVRFSSHCPT